MTSTPLGESSRPSPGSAEARAGLVGRMRAIVLVATTLFAIVLLGSVDACQLVTRSLTGDGETVRMQPVRIDPAECDTRFGESLLETLPAAVSASDRQRVLFIGNSQQYTASLPRGAQPDDERKVEMASVLFGRQLERERPGRFSVYTAAAPNQTFTEALWQGVYWFEVSPRPPAVLVLQSSFDTYRKSGIRPGFQTLLDDESFASALEKLEREKPGRAWADELTLARKTKVERERALADEASKRETFEGRLRAGLEHLPLFARRQNLRASFLNALYLVRVHALGISPTTKRHITGQPLEQNFHALEDLIALARARGATVLVYNAPINPAIDMFFQDEYAAYLERLRATTEKHGAHFTDLASAVNEQHWGYWVDAPDPIHFNEHGHVELSRALWAFFGWVLMTDGVH